MKYFLLLLIALSSVSAQDADWGNAIYYYDDNGNGNSWGPGGKKNPIVPEPSAYGLVMFSGLIAYSFIRRKGKK